MEPTNNPFRKENDLPNLQEYVPAVNLSGVYSPLVFVKRPGKKLAAWKSFPGLVRRSQAWRGKETVLVTFDGHTPRN